MKPLPAEPWSRAAQDVVDGLSVDAARGLSQAEVLRRRGRFGPNVLKEAARRNVAMVLAGQFANIVIALLLAAAVVAFAFGDLAEAAAIFVVIVINAGIGFVTELRAIRSIEALRRLGQVHTAVLREGTRHRLVAHELVPGDIVLLEAGDIVAADLRLIEAAKLQVDESALTGESLPVDKHIEPLPADTHVADRENQAYKGTAVTRGSATGVVVATGLGTELGRISDLVATADTKATPLEKRLDTLARRLAWAVIVIAVAIASIGMATGRELRLAVEVAIALAVAAIPEGLPIVATIALSRGMWRMAKRNALIARLSAVETLGATSIILTDKTGTLTENRMTLTRIEIASASVTVGGTGLELQGGFEAQGAPLDASLHEGVEALLRLLVLCNNATLTKEQGSAEPRVTGDPTEVALLVAAAKLGLDPAAVAAELPEVREEAFDSRTKLMATLHQVAGGEILVAVKGAPEAVLERCVAYQDGRGQGVALDDAARQDWERRCDALAAEGLRLLAVARGTVPRADADPYRQLTLVGVVALMDPPRARVRESLAACRDAGIDVVMVTGDHLTTARSVAAALGLSGGDGAPEAGVDASGLGPFRDLPPERLESLLASRVIARATPEQKLDLIALHQERGRVVAMTGDGVNDAPALKKADIGVAMGKRGTEVAREAAAMVLQDDEFSTIVSAIAQGRVIFANIRKFVVYLLSCNLSEVFVVGLATIAGAPLPLLPLQILFLNLVTDVFPALALGVGEGAGGVMGQPPRPAREPILTRGRWLELSGHALVMSASVLGAMAISVFVLGLADAQAVTVSFLTLASAQMWHVFNMRARGEHWLRNEITTNPWVWMALVLCAVLLGVALYVPAVAAVLALTRPTPAMWLLALSMSIIPVLVGPLPRLARR